MRTLDLTDYDEHEIALHAQHEERHGRGRDLLEPLRDLGTWAQ